MRQGVAPANTPNHRACLCRHAYPQPPTPNRHPGPDPGFGFLRQGQPSSGHRIKAAAAAGWNRQEAPRSLARGPLAPAPRCGTLGPVRRILLSALIYAGAIFTLGFALGTLRVLAIAPHTGPLLAVALELPLMLAASAWLAHRLVRRAALNRKRAAAMGLVALALLLSAERALAGPFGQSGAEWLAAMLTPAGLLGLAGQVWFGLMPGVVARPVDG